MATPDRSTGEQELARVIGRQRLGALREAAGRPDGRPLRDALRELLAEADEQVGEAPGAATPGERSAVDEELRVARRIQRSLVRLTAAELRGWEIASDYRPAREIGGDFFDVFPLPDPDRADQLAVVIADVSGKGISAALLMAFLRPVIRAALDHTGRPAEALERANRILVEERPTGLFVTVLCGVLDLADGSFRFSSAGHEAPVVVRADGAPPGAAPDGGPLMGLFARLDLAEQEIELEAGDLLVLYTDGITDAKSGAGERFGFDRFLDELGRGRAEGAEAVTRRVISAVLAFQGETDPADDLALLVVRRP